MVAILAVLAHHLVGWPRGGFVGIDIFFFFAITGFLITGSLLRTADDAGTGSFGRFYANRAALSPPSS